MQSGGSRMAANLTGKLRLKLWRKTLLEQKIKKEEIGMLGEETEGVEEEEVTEGVTGESAGIKTRGVAVEREVTKAVKEVMVLVRRRSMSTRTLERHLQTK